MSNDSGERVERYATSPDQQCTLPSCERPAVDPTRSGALCASHLDAIEPGKETDDKPDHRRDEPASSSDQAHENPIDVSDVTDDERAEMLRQYLKAFVAEFEHVPRLMPLDEEGKAPIIQGRCSLDSPKGREYIVDGEEAIRQIREEGARGFAIYAGKGDHRTGDLVLVDVDDRETFPYDAFPDTLTVLSGSGRGEHFTFRNAGDVENAKGKGDVDGEVRAENWFCVTPGSLHPSGGIYHVINDRPVSDLSSDTIPNELLPGSSRRNRDKKNLPEPPADDAALPEDETVEKRLERAFQNPHDGDRMRQVYNGKYSLAGFDDRSSAEYWFANRIDSWVAYGDTTIVRKVMNRGNLQKWDERPDSSYRDSILADIGFQDWYYDPDSSDPDGNESTDLTVTLDPEIAWRAASNILPDDLEGELSLAVTNEGDGWVCSTTGATVDVVRAVAIDEQMIVRADEPLRDKDYDRAYRMAREKYDAPLPEYVTAATATDRWAVIQGALEQFTHRHLSVLKSTVTGIGSDDSGVIAEINPCWDDSGSEKRIIALETGGFYCRKHERTIDPLRFVALETSLIDKCDEPLAGEEFKAAYHTAREEFGAPLPKWTVGNLKRIPVLPPAESLVGEFTTDIDSLDTARAKVEDLYRDLADDAGETKVLNALPALGKTTSVVKNADEYPALYLGPRKELQKEVDKKAREYGVTVMHLPVFAEKRVTNEAMMQALAIVRKDGKDILKNRTELVSRLNHPVFTEEEDEMERDEIDLPRASCPTANGDNGEPWALVFQVARELGHTPREILTRGKALFGEDPPVSSDEDPYSQAWKQVTDPEEPIDLLIGSYGHAHVGGARTYYQKNENRTKQRPRAVAIDEFPGLDPYESKFGERYLDHAAWLARCLRDDVDDRQALFETDLWDDEWIRAWLEGNATALEDIERTVTSFETMQNALDVLDTVCDLLENNSDSLQALGLEEVLSSVTACHPEWNRSATQKVYQELSNQLDQVTSDSNVEQAVLKRLDDDVLPSLASLSVTLNRNDSPILPLTTIDRVSGDLNDLCETAVSAFSDHRNDAHGLLEAAKDAVEGGEAGCRALAVHARDGYAHPDAHLLLFGQLADGKETTTVRTEAYTFGGDDETNLKRTTLGRATILTDRNHHGAVIHQPPEFTTNDGNENPVIGLDATANERLWSMALGQNVDVTDIHETDAERRQFLQNVLNLQVVQTSSHINSYSGATASKNFDGDVALVKQVASEYNGRLRADTLTQTTKPGVITTKKVRAEIGDRIEGTVDELDHYGNVTGSNALSECNIGVVLGARHFGDAYIEKWAAFAGEEVSRSGRGTDLDYVSDVANDVLKHMRHDETMQAVLRFGRDEEGAVVFAHTAALRDDLPIVGEGAVVQAHSKNAKTVALAARKFRSRSFTVGDLAGNVDCSRRTIRRVLAGFADLGYLDRHETKNGVANEYRLREDPGTGEVSLPDIDLDAKAPDSPVQEQDYTWNVRVNTQESYNTTSIHLAETILPAPDVPNNEVTSVPPG